MKVRKKSWLPRWIRLEIHLKTPLAAKNQRETFINETFITRQSDTKGKLAYTEVEAWVSVKLDFTSVIVSANIFYLVFTNIGCKRILQSATVPLQDVIVPRGATIRLKNQSSMIKDRSFLHRYISRLLTCLFIQKSFLKVRSATFDVDKRNQERHAAPRKFV